MFLENKIRKKRTLASAFCPRGITYYIRENGDGGAAGKGIRFVCEIMIMIRYVQGSNHMNSLLFFLIIISIVH